MNKNKKILASLFVILLFSISAFAGNPPPVGGDPTDDGGSTPIGGTAPISSGITIFIGMGLAYAAAKTYLLVRVEE